MLRRIRYSVGVGKFKGQESEDMQKRNKYLSSFSKNAEQVKVLLTELERTELTDRKIRAILPVTALNSTNCSIRVTGRFGNSGLRMPGGTVPTS